MLGRATDEALTSGPRRPLTIVLLARLKPGVTGGIEQAVVGTVAALGRLTDGDERYIVVTDPAAGGWLDPYIGSNTRIAVHPVSQLSVLDVAPAWRVRARTLLRPLVPAVRAARGVVGDMRRHIRGNTWSLAGEDPFIEGLGGDVVHFPYQWLHRTSAPAVFNPQDVLHAHHPGLLSPAVVAYRQHMYTLWCREATVVEVPSQASKEDVIRYLGAPVDKILVVPKAAPTELSGSPGKGELRVVRRQYALPAAFALYPAQTWSHKNHLRLVEAVAIVRDRYGVRLHVVCTGHQNDFWPTIQARTRALRVAEQITFLGFVPAEHVRALYHLAEFSVFPTLFEGGGFPLLEALRDGCPLACSDLPVLREQAGDAALLFDPSSTDAIAHALLRMHTEPDLRDGLRQRGMARAGYYTWERTARTYRALYRRLGGYLVDDEDRRLLSKAAGERAHA